MMHRNDFVVSICPVGGKAYREYGIDGQRDTSNTRIRKINIPFNQEYELRFKNMRDVRRSVRIDIDGTNVGCWVVPASYGSIPSEVTLERFSDSDKRFKVLSLDDGGVDDPNNPDNGIINIEVVDEMRFIDTRKRLRDFSADGRGITRGFGGASGSSACYSTGPINLSSVNIGASNVATGEGSKSEQVFGITHWHGDSGTPFYFIFKLNGVNRSVVKTGYCIECGSKLANNSKFCHECGTKTMVLA